MDYTHVLNRRWGPVRSPANLLAAPGPDVALETPSAPPPVMLHAGRHITTQRDGTENWKSLERQPDKSPGPLDRVAMLHCSPVGHN